MAAFVVGLAFRSWRPRVEGQTGFGDEAVEDGRAVLEALQPVADQGLQDVDAHGGEVGQTALEMGPHAFGRVQIRA